MGLLINVLYSNFLCELYKKINKNEYSIFTVAQCFAPKMSVQLRQLCLILLQLEMSNMITCFTFS